MLACKNAERHVQSSFLPPALSRSYRSAHIGIDDENDDNKDDDDDDAEKEEEEEQVDRESTRWPLPPRFRELGMRCRSTYDGT